MVQCTQVQMGLWDVENRIVLSLCCGPIKAVMMRYNSKHQERCPLYCGCGFLCVELQFEPFRAAMVVSCGINGPPLQRWS
jgi:hypothetical protein